MRVVTENKESLAEIWDLEQDLGFNVFQILKYHIICIKIIEFTVTLKFTDLQYA